MLAMLAEAARALEEGVVESPRELDLATVFGMGFAPFRGGLLAWADTLGTRAIVERLEALAGRGAARCDRGVSGGRRLVCGLREWQCLCAGCRFQGSLAHFHRRERWRCAVGI